MEDKNHPQAEAEHRVQLSLKWVAVIVTVIVLAPIISILLLNSYDSSRTFQPYVTYDYAIGVSSNSSDQFDVLCPFPVDEEGSLCTRAQGYLHIIGNATATNVSTEYGQALRVHGTGLVVITWSVKSTPPDPGEGYPGCRHLSLRDGSDARVYSDIAGVLFDLRYHWGYVYGNLGAEFVTYEIVGNLQAGWNFLPVDYSSAIA